MATLDEIEAQLHELRTERDAVNTNYKEQIKDLQIQRDEQIALMEAQRKVEEGGPAEVLVVEAEGA